ncbi:type II secretion system minor pseudopilin GspK [Massilia sp. LC238]|uniref:type II secretion system minor pseudopilin GspK n=1 Tax=Massilia sp. LC238 TaxID=1502852 RepID=UPI0004E31FD2|nr:type II secretion system minor pseudopilin GspK [Massilia sp. LC238]KFC76394.1 Type II secretion system protein K [Massilia sp. LC238]
MRRPPPSLRQRGVAVVTALLLTTLAISIVASLFWQQQVQVRSMENQRLHLQTKWILRGALDWASLVLRQDAYTSQYTSLDQVWATPLAETRLDQYIERERVEGENFDATLSGNIIDATSRYNLVNLAKDRQKVPEQVEIFRRLLDNLRLDARLANRIADFVAQGQQVGVPVDPNNPNPPNPNPPDPNPPNPTSVLPPVPPANGVPIPLMQVDDLLAVQGVTQEVMAKLRPFVIVLPYGTEATKLNVNTVPAELLSAIVPGMSLSQANSLVARRKTAAWRTPADFSSQAANNQQLDDTWDIKSRWFIVQSRIRLDRAALNAESLIERTPVVSVGGGTRVIWTRQN